MARASTKGRVTLLAMLIAAGIDMGMARLLVLGRVRVMVMRGAKRRVRFTLSQFASLS